MCVNKMIFKKKTMFEDSSEQIVISIPGMVKWIRCLVGNLFKRKKMEYIKK